MKSYRPNTIIGTWTLCDCWSWERMAKQCKRVPLYLGKTVKLPKPGAARRRKARAA